MYSAQVSPHIVLSSIKLYNNLASIVLLKIHEKYHQYLRLVSPSWKKISVSLNFANKDPWNIYDGYDFDQYILRHEKIKFSNQYLLSIDFAMVRCRFFLTQSLDRCDGIKINDKILIKLLIDEGTHINRPMLEKYPKDLQIFILNCLYSSF